MLFTLPFLLPAAPSTFLPTKTPPNPNPSFFPISSSAQPNPPPSQPSTTTTTTTRRRRRTKTTTTNKKAAPLQKKAAGRAEPRRGRRSEAAAVEDYVRDTLHRTLDAIKDGKGEVLEEEEGEGEEIEEEVKGGVVEEDDPDWPVDSEVGWGVRASEYFEKHPIRNVVEGGVEIDWEGELDDAWVKEINCLEWESFAFHPSPLIVLAFERYNRASENWKVLKELEEAIKVYWCAKDRLPPRTVKIDVNIEKDLAYALKALECPQLLFLRGNRILYREKEFRTADELVKMIAHFYYNAKKPAWIDEAALAPKY